jgi:hypothetical protein
MSVTQNVVIIHTLSSVIVADSELLYSISHMINKTSINLVKQHIF